MFSEKLLTLSTQADNGFSGERIGGSPRDKDKRARLCPVWKLLPRNRVFLLRIEELQSRGDSLE